MVEYLAIAYTKVALIVGAPGFLWSLFYMRDEIGREAAMLGPVVYFRLMTYWIVFWPFWFLSFVPLSLVNIFVATFFLIGTFVRGEPAPGDRRLAISRLGQGFVAVAVVYVVYRCFE